MRVEMSTDCLIGCGSKNFKILNTIGDMAPLIKASQWQQLKASKIFYSTKNMSLSSYLH